MKIIIAPKKKNYLRIPWIVQVKKLVWSVKGRSWCGLPYPNHPRGCPNWKTRCPQWGPYVDSLMDIEKPMWLVHSEFDLAGHVEKMRALHPLWSERQLRNVLYWQNSSRRQLRGRAAMAFKLLPVDYILWGAEYAGVNLYATAYKSGLRLERIRELKTCRHMVILGTGKTGSKNQYHGA